MSGIYTSMAVRVLGLRPPAKVVLWILADISQDDPENPALTGKSWLTQGQIADRAEIDLKTVRKALTTLQERDLIRVDKEPGTDQGRHQYYINPIVLEQEYELGKAQTRIKDRQRRDTEAQRRREYRARQRNIKVVENFLKQQTQHVENQTKNSLP